MPEPPDTPPAGAESAATSLTLLQRLRANEPDAWRVMVHLYTPLVHRWCSRLGVHGADADDVSQDVFRAAALHLGQFHREKAGDTFRGWLKAITRNACLMHFRRTARQPQASGGTDALVLLGELADPAGAADDANDVDEVGLLNRRALELVRDEFESRTWEMFWATVIDNRAPVDMAAEMGVTPAAVRKAKSRVLRRLKERFADLLL
jgi:RNA polymerase sigma-70 factor (ECF subfamily)